MLLLFPYSPHLQVAEAVASSSESLGGLSSNRPEVDGEMDYGLSAMIKGHEEDEEEEGEQVEGGAAVGEGEPGKESDQDEDVDAEEWEAEAEEVEEEEEEDEVLPIGAQSCASRAKVFGWFPL